VIGGHAAENTKQHIEMIVNQYNFDKKIIRVAFLLIIYSLKIRFFHHYSIPIHYTRLWFRTVDRIIESFLKKSSLSRMKKQMFL
jgi:hypothetical protein